MAVAAERSYEPISDADLRRLASLAREDIDGFFARHPDTRRGYANRLICTALCQGAALHYVDGKNGVKDFDVFTFFAKHPDPKVPRIPYRRHGFADFGESKFGVHPDDAGYAGRRVDLFMRAVDCGRGCDPVEAVRRYLGHPPTATAWHLAQKAIVLIYPDRLRGKIAWPIR